MPALRLEELLLMAHPKIPERGRDLFLNNEVSKTRREGTTLTARVQGSSSYPYRVTIDLEAGAWSCTCPYEQGAVCKHVYATALAGLETPELFQETSRRTTSALQMTMNAVAQLEENDLYALLEAVAELHPEIAAEFAANLERRNGGW
jgi:uncharacterized Zn finger protein